MYKSRDRPVSRWYARAIWPTYWGKPPCYFQTIREQFPGRAKLYWQPYTGIPSHSDRLAGRPLLYPLHLQPKVPYSCIPRDCSLLNYSFLSLGVHRAVLQAVACSLAKNGSHDPHVQGVRQEHRRNGSAFRRARDGHDRDDLRRDGKMIRFSVEVTVSKRDGVRLFM